MPDHGLIEVFRQPHGMGIRLDDGPGFVGATITPHYDSLLVKITGRAQTRANAAAKLRRALKEFRIRGVETNISFLSAVLGNDEFIDGVVTTGFIDENPYLLDPRVSIRAGREANRAQKLLAHIANMAVNGPPPSLGAALEKGSAYQPSLVDPLIPTLTPSAISHPHGAEKKATEDPTLMETLRESGPAAFAKQVREHKGALVTDTTWRDAHQSLLATRLRTYDIKEIAPATSVALANAYSIENWGGATFDVSMRFLHECPWDRLGTMRELVPNIPFQMLMRGANAVGYTAYPDNVVHAFCDRAVEHGMDVFRVFDSLNYIENMRLGIDAVGGAGGVVEAAICYTGDVMNPRDGKYTLEYYLDFARQVIHT